MYLLGTHHRLLNYLDCSLETLSLTQSIKSEELRSQKPFWSDRQVPSMAVLSSHVSSFVTQAHLINSAIMSTASDLEIVEGEQHKTVEFMKIKLTMSMLETPAPQIQPSTSSIPKRKGRHPNAATLPASAEQSAVSSKKSKSSSTNGSSNGTPRIDKAAMDALRQENEELRKQLADVSCSELLSLELG
jgi:hypothetical protein